MTGDKIGDMVADERNYDDIIDYEYKGSASRAAMSAGNRAAQFSPFAALTGFDDEITEVARMTGERVEQGERELAELDEKISYLRSVISDLPEIKIVYFVPDLYKKGGEYRFYTGRLRKIDDYSRTLLFEGGFSVGTADVAEIDIVRDNQNIL